LHSSTEDGKWRSDPKEAAGPLVISTACIKKKQTSASNPKGKKRVDVFRALMDLSCPELAKERLDRGVRQKFRTRMLTQERKGKKRNTPSSSGNSI